MLTWELFEWLKHSFYKYFWVFYDKIYYTCIFLTNNKRCTSWKAERSEEGPIENVILRSIDEKKKAWKIVNFQKESKKKKRSGFRQKNVISAPTKKNVSFVINNDGKIWSERKTNYIKPFFSTPMDGFKPKPKKNPQEGNKCIVLYPKPSAYSNKCRNLTITSLVCLLCSLFFQNLSIFGLSGLLLYDLMPVIKQIYVTKRSPHSNWENDSHKTIFLLLFSFYVLFLLYLLPSAA